MDKVIVYRSQIEASWDQSLMNCLDWMANILVTHPLMIATCVAICVVIVITSKRKSRHGRH